MLKIAQMRNDVMSRFHNALYLGDVEERVRILEEVGQLSLAYILADSHGLAEDAARLKQRLENTEAQCLTHQMCTFSFHYNIQGLHELATDRCQRRCLCCCREREDDVEETVDADQVWEDEGK